MPKEKITFINPKAWPEADADGVVVLREEPVPPQVAIHWDTNLGDVQLSISVGVDDLRKIIADYDAGIRYGGEDGEDRIGILTEGLDRSELQRLIRHSRRARDAVYGSDE